MKVVAYHGGPVPIRKFSLDKVQMGLWFSEDRDKILRGESGAADVKWLMRCELDPRRVAGRDEYEALMLDQLEAAGYDAVSLEGDWLVLDAGRVRVLSVERALAAEAEAPAGRPARGRRAAPHGRRR